MSSGGTDVDAVSTRSSLTMAFSSPLFIKQDCSFDSVSESYQLLSAVLKFKGMIVRDGHTGRKSFRCRHDVSTSPSTLTKRSRALGTRSVPSFPEYCCAWFEKRDYSPFERRLKVHEPIFEQQIRIYNAKRLWVFL